MKLINLILAAVFVSFSGCGGGPSSSPENDASSIIGAWTVGAGSDYSVLVFLDDTRYLVAHTNNSEFDAVIGAVVPVSAEYGTYTWNTTTGAFTVSALGQSDGEGGLARGIAQPEAGVTAAVDTRNLTLTGTDPAPIVLPKVASANSIIGAWSIGTGIDYSVIVFLDETRYIVVHTDNSELDSFIGAVVPVSAEYGTYTWDTTTGVFTATMQGQSDGEGGLSNPRGEFALAIDRSSLTLTDSIDGPITLSRVE